MMQINFMLEPVALSKLSITVSIGQTTFLLNVKLKCTTSTQLAESKSLSSLRQDFLGKTHLLQDVTPCLSFYSLKEN